MTHIQDISVQIKSNPLIYPFHPKPDISYREIYHLVKDIPIEGIIYLFAQTESDTLKEKYNFFIIRYMNTTVELNGRDLIELGYHPGPDYTEFQHRFTPPFAPMIAHGTISRKRSSFDLPEPNRMKYPAAQ